MKKLFYLLVLTLCLTLGLNAQDDNNSATLRNIVNQAEYVGGDSALLQSLARNLHVPGTFCGRMNGRVVLKFYIKENGYINHDSIIVVRSLDPDFDKYTINAVKRLDRFIPPKDKNGKNIGSWFTLPVNFIDETN